MAKAQLDFSGARGIIDPLEGLKTSVQQTNSTLGQMIVQNEAEKQQELTRARQARQDALATPGSPEWLAAKEAEKTLRLDMMGAEHDWNMKNNPTYRATIPGTEEYETLRKNKTADQISLIDAQSAARLREQLANPATKILMSKYAQEQKLQAGQEALAKEIMGLPTEIVTKTEVTPAQREAAKLGLESAAVVNAGDVYNREFAKLRTPVTVSEPVLVEGYEVTPGSTAVMSEEEAHQEALKRAGLLDVVAGKSPVINESVLPKVGVTESKKKLTTEELTQAKLNAAIKAAQEGKVPAALALEVANKLTPTKTQKESLEEAKFALDVEEFKEKKAKNYYGKSGSGSGKGDWLKTLEETYKTYGTPDVLGEGQRAGIELTLSKLQSRENASDADMASAIESSRGVYAYPGGLGVDEDKFKEAVELNLLKIIRDKKTKELGNK